MKEGFAVEGFIREDGTKMPLEKYDDTELRAKIQKNVDDIDNLKSSVQGLGTSKADKVHEHVYVRRVTDYGKALVEVDVDGECGGEVTLGVKDANGPAEYAFINIDTIGNLKRALADPSTTPENDATKLITSKAVYDALMSLVSADSLIRQLHLTIPSGDTYSAYRVVDWVDRENKEFDYVLETPGSVTLMVQGGAYSYGGPGAEDVDEGEVTITKSFYNQHGARVSWNIYDELIAAGDAAYGSVDYVKDITILAVLSGAQQSDKVVVVSVLPSFDS